MTTEGRAQLESLDASLRDIAAAAGVSRSTARRWRIGEKVPSPEERQKLRKVFGIPVGAWDSAEGRGEREAAPSQEPAAGPYPPRPAGDASTLEHARYLLQCIRVDLVHPDLTITARSKLRSDEARTLGLIAKLERDVELAEARYVQDHPEWRRLKQEILDALKKHPAAAKAVAEAIRWPRA